MASAGLARVPVRTPAAVPPAAGDHWHRLVNRGAGYLSFYYSDELARYPVRQLTRPADNKSDPNIETMTYGLFSTCEPQMRNLVVVNGAATIFFVTRHSRRPRAVTGYYEIGWYTLGARGEGTKDWALAARVARFVDPMALSELSAIPETVTPFRTQRPLSVASTHSLRALVDAKPDRTIAYVVELHRVERFAKSRTGYAYPSWGRENGFTLTDAEEFLATSTGGAPNSSPTRQWICTSCHAIVPNQALLRRCSACQEPGTLRPFRPEDK
jgi:hypothetical protein